jgi:hypothetical protein
MFFYCIIKLTEFIKFIQINYIFFKNNDICLNIFFFIFEKI